jgi:hypothetical protein
MFEVLQRAHDVRRIEQISLPTTGDYVKPGLKRGLHIDDQGILTTSILSEVRGHTSFLTFATIFPSMNE